MSAVVDRQQAAFITDKAETNALLDDMSQRYLGVPYHEFLRRFDRGEYAQDREQPEIVRLAMLRRHFV
jgi:hypothetical protein